MVTVVKTTMRGSKVVGSVVSNREYGTADEVLADALRSAMAWEGIAWGVASVGSPVACEVREGDTL